MLQIVITLGWLIAFGLMAYLVTRALKHAYWAKTEKAGIQENPRI